MPDVSTDDNDDSVGNYDYSLFSQTMADKDLSPAKRTKQANIAGRDKRAASRSTGSTARRIFNHYYLHWQSPYFHKLSREMLSQFLIRFGTNSNDTKEMVAAVEAKEFPDIEEWLTK